ncbi:FKBP-type peptidyl-prolyl cis-trans isomerase [Candidatus Sumerlaeota bacterium]|nr:FKBP-type peptidyl-prolyl cis-trans isomerase [Candidatus Sumerlaeota bacterium]
MNKIHRLLMTSTLFATVAMLSYAQETTQTAQAVDATTSPAVTELKEEPLTLPNAKRIVHLAVAGDETTGPESAIVKTEETDKGLSVTLANKLAYINLVDGFSSQTVGLGDEAYVHYRGTIAKTGKVIDDSRLWRVLPNPARVVVGERNFLKGFESGIMGMRVGGKRLVFIPSELGYGKKGSMPEVPPDTDLLFEMDLVRLKRGNDWVTSIGLSEKGYR